MNGKRWTARGLGEPVAQCLTIRRLWVRILPSIPMLLDLQPKNFGRRKPSWWEFRDLELSVRPPHISATSQGKVVSVT